jgi:uncharacterized protein YciI
VHALVLMVPRDPGWVDDDEVQRRHEQYIDELDQRKKVVLGGQWIPPAGPFAAAYVLSCESLREAREIAQTDPLVQANAIECQVVEWQLVGVNPDAVDRGALLFP